MPFALLEGVGIDNSMNAPDGVMRPILFPAAAASVNQRLLSGPTVIAEGPPLAVGTGNSMNTAAGVMRPILLACGSVNQRLPSGPLVRPPESPPLGTPYSLKVPDGIMRPIPPCFVYQTLPSGPPVMATGPVLVVVVLKSMKLVPDGANRPMALGAVLWCVNQRLPSGPAVMAPGLLGVGIANSVSVMLGPLPKATVAPSAGGAPEPPSLVDDPPPAPMLPPSDPVPV